MKYQEKMQYAKEAAKEMNNGKPISEIKKTLKDKGLYKNNIDTILFNAKRMLLDQYLDKIKTYLLNDSFEEKIAEFSSLDKEVLQDIKEKTIRKIKSDSKRMVNRLVKEGLPDEEIQKKVENRIFNSGEVYKQILFYKKYNEAPKGEEKIKFLLIGITSLVLGIIITIYKVKTGGRRLYIGGLLIGYGGWNIYKAFTPPGVAEISNPNNRF